MPEDDKPALVAILNNNEDLIRMLSEALRDAGFGVVSVRLVDARAGKANLAEFVREHNPEVVVFDLALPFRTNWFMLEDLRRDGILDGRGLVVTTPNRQAVEDLLRFHGSLEITGQPEEFQAFLSEVRRALEEARRERERTD